MAELPPILDFEASSLSDTSYPITAGLVISGHVYYWIIKSEPEWIDWSLQSQAIHGLKCSYTLVQIATRAKGNTIAIPLLSRLMPTAGNTGKLRAAQTLIRSVASVYRGKTVRLLVDS